MVSLLVAAAIVVGTWSLFRQSVHLLFDGVPDGGHLPAVQALLAGPPGVPQLTDLDVRAPGQQLHARGHRRSQLRFLCCIEQRNAP